MVLLLMKIFCIVERNKLIFSLKNRYSEKLREYLFLNYFFGVDAIVRDFARRTNPYTSTIISRGIPI